MKQQVTDPNGLPSYVSSAPDLDLAQKQEVNHQDQADMASLEKVMKLLRDRKAYYNSTSSLKYGFDITVENQLIINTQMGFHIDELESLITSAINRVKEQENESRF